MPRPRRLQLLPFSMLFLLAAECAAAPTPKADIHAKRVAKLMRAFREKEMAVRHRYDAMKGVETKLQKLGVHVQESGLPTSLLPPQPLEAHGAGTPSKSASMVYAMGQEEMRLADSGEKDVAGVIDLKLLRKLAKGTMALKADMINQKVLQAQKNRFVTILKHLDPQKRERSIKRSEKDRQCYRNKGKGNTIMGCSNRVATVFNAGGKPGVSGVASAKPLFGNKANEAEKHVAKAKLSLSKLGMTKGPKIKKIPVPALTQKQLADKIKARREILKSRESVSTRCRNKCVGAPMCFFSCMDALNPKLKKLKKIKKTQKPKKKVRRRRSAPV